ncbi:MAG: FeoA family protein [bacterium]|nr:ferrous iron transport protein A [bacterium]
MVPLNQLNEGDFGEIVEISGCRQRQCQHKRGWKKRFLSDPDDGRNGRMADLGLRIGKVIQLLQKGKQGPILIKVDESRIAVGQKMAQNIFIKDQHGSPS